MLQPEQKKKNLKFLQRWTTANKSLGWRPCTINTTNDKNKKLLNTFETYSNNQVIHACVAITKQLIIMAELQYYTTTSWKVNFYFLELLGISTYHPESSLSSLIYIGQLATYRVNNLPCVTNMPRVLLNCWPLL